MVVAYPLIHYIFQSYQHPPGLMFHPEHANILLHTSNPAGNRAAIV